MLPHKAQTPLAWRRMASPSTSATITLFQQAPVIWFHLVDWLRCCHYGGDMRSSLNSNSFIGPIPPSIGNLSDLYWLDLADNKLSGATPGLDMLVNTKHLFFLLHTVILERISSLVKFHLNSSVQSVRENM
ncbi:hypothetical protein HYC85_010030 [Camellia sinensis]|uniref:Leucine-rich repeat-containing N-terminal plant-type domain-containing protein n=1 Tax=Camellia sinensis TaxID=4442 RepID=A0A7J7HJJ2_CAMSI|nr:hypothetical protein HYC85_010030 [Camellia sinensis]